MHDDLIIGAVVLARLIIPLFISRYPLPAIIASLVIDALDQTIFQSFTHRNLAGYQTYDKALDVYYLTLAYLSTIRNWGGGPDFEVGRLLWYYRLIGVAVFEYTSAGWILLVFPNTFEYYFIAIEWFKARRDPNLLSRRQVWKLAVFIWVVIKIPQEWWIHVADLDFTDFLKTHLFGAANASSWSSAISHRPIGVFVLIGALAALVTAMVLGSRRLPPAQWAMTLNADRQDELMGGRAPRPEAHPRAFFGWAFAEKVVLVTMVSAIFARILPGADTRITTVVLATTYLVAVNTVLSQFLARRGTSWRNTAVQFTWMTLANLVVVVVSTAALGSTERASPWQTTTFLVALLTLIVVLYDRSHGIFSDQQDRRNSGRSAIDGSTLVER